MPKMKTHKGTAKRFRRTGSGKIMRAKAFQDRFPAHGFQLGAAVQIRTNEELIRYGTSQARRRRP